MGQPAQSTHEAAHKNINLAKAAKEEARPSQERLRRIKRGNSETASSSASSSKQETSWIYRTKRANKRSNCRPQGCMESQEYPSSNASKSTHDMVSQSENWPQQANLADTASEAVSQDYMYQRSSCGAKGTEVSAAAGQHEGMKRPATRNVRKKCPLC